MRPILIIGISLAALPCPAFAAETVTYTYDALGRLTATTHSGGDNNGMAQSITYDAAGNRTQYQVTGSQNRGIPEGAVIVLPLNGFTIIPISQ